MRNEISSEVKMETLDLIFIVLQSCTFSIEVQKDFQNVFHRQTEALKPNTVEFESKTFSDRDEKSFPDLEVGMMFESQNMLGDTVDSMNSSSE